ncbi:hypothetical protein Esi_0200_0005 [Ectocarpus siliculosus]|uniref:Uncharacterized protein n=1 Tax=Ectocarpus siliculosus TaxID=2880 RepID=D7FQG9_ECTSI|nr:hypothetical protein Esi_0200_0005 [Ectocarpus siliculosus]|eukprot:CBJ30564.1 hypothetical protein Esi_0200_0005 [Ectocarpus siliculosus]
MRRKKSNILSLEARVLEKREQVQKTARRLAREKQDFLSGNFVRTWRTGFNALKASEQDNRMSDKQLPVRSHSLVDNEVWQMAEIRRWFDSHSSPQAIDGFNPLASGYTMSSDKNGALPPLLRIQRVPTPKWAAAEDRKIIEKSRDKREQAMRFSELQDRHFADFEGNLDVQRARTAVLASRLKPPKGWGPHHTHVAGFRTPPWKERPPQEAPRYKPPQVFRDRDIFLQVTGPSVAFLSIP